ncbi:MAG: hypothetical protein ACE141_05115 [Bryobacteraceae bacterium]
MRSTDYNRRQFLKTAGSLPVAGAVAGGAGRTVSLVSDPSDSVACSAPPQWALGELEKALAARGVKVERRESAAQATGELCIIAAGRENTAVRQMFRAAGVAVAAEAEALGLAPATVNGKPALAACGHDARGLVYALLELADRVEHSGDPMAALTAQKPVVEQPANRIRSLTRLFCSDVEDKPWYNDREMWPHYLTTLATQRFNRFNLSLGIGYDFLREVTDGYFLFAYPFLLSVPGYNVRVPQLPDAERDRNLEMLKFISEQTVARGLQFQLGIWMHGYEWVDSPKPNYTIEGLTRETHGPYCRDALRMLLKACPAISGITFRIHGESGVEEGNYDLWKTIFDGVATCGRTVEVDMHAKGMDQNMLDVAVATGMPVTVSPKYWAEHLGLPYHQADIRELEVPRPERRPTGFTANLMKLSAGSRSFLRYGYGDLLREGRRWGVVHRIWPGTQRLLLWGDPLSAAAHSRAFGFCGSDGVEIMEPLSFKGRRGSGIAGDRCGYADRALQPRWDWQKYLYTHRVWGRLLYNPSCDPDVWRRYLRAQFGPGSASAEEGLARASRILPLVTTSHGTSAGNNTYWPEVYLNQSMIDARNYGPYSDTPAPRVFGNVSPLDPQLFSRINDFADALLKGEPSAKYSPVEAAQWIEDYAAEAARQLALFEKQATGRDRPEYRRLAIDLVLQIGIGRFFSAKFRSGVLYRIFEQTGDRTALEESLKQYRTARAAFAEAGERAKGIYVPDITVGEHPQLRGHWLDRLPAMDADIAAIAAKLDQTKAGQPAPRVQAAIREALGRPRRASLGARHDPPRSFRPGQPLIIGLTPERPVASVRMYYRHVNHAERYQSVAMDAKGSQYHAVIPAGYTDSAFPIQYYFEVSPEPGVVTLYPGLGPELVEQPYFVVRRAS